jgi:hypothetical protein
VLEPFPAMGFIVNAGRFRIDSLSGTSITNEIRRGSAVSVISPETNAARHEIEP